MGVVLWELVVARTVGCQPSWVEQLTREQQEVGLETVSGHWSPLVSHWSLSRRVQKQWCLLLQVLSPPRGMLASTVPATLPGHHVTGGAVRRRSPAAEGAAKTKTKPGTMKIEEIIAGKTTTKSFIPAPLPLPAALSRTRRKTEE